ncbi:MAG: nonstructural protein [Wigfec virus K19_151]|nr:MAG: nonstructural protein [Wigfec virus K19_151]
MQKIFTVHDSKAQAYLPPFYMRTKGEAIRAFETTVKDTNSQFNKYPQDYTLVELGEFDDNTGSIITLPSPLIISNASEFLH